VSAPALREAAHAPSGPASRWTRKQVWSQLGAPTDQIGSVNDPRAHDECGVRWNEKWIYLDGREIVRIALWHRYDFLGAFRANPDGSFEPEPLPEPAPH